MGRTEIIQELRKYFKISELVCEHTFAKWGERAWRFLDTDYLHALLIVRRDILQRPMTCNNASAHQRGLRCNLCELVKTKTSNYLSAHILGKAGDFTVQGMSAEQAREMIKAKANKLPCNIRLEKGVTWLHMDVLPQEESRVYEFSV